MSRTTHSRFLQPFTFPDEAARLQLSWEKLRGGTSCEMVRLVFRPIPGYNERLARQWRYEPPPEFSPDFALPRLKFTIFQVRTRVSHSNHFQDHIGMEVRGVCVKSVLSMLLCVCLLCVAAHQRMCVYPQHMCKCEVTVCVSELRTHKKSNCFFWL